MGSQMPYPLHETVTEKLERGKERTTQLQALIKKSCGGGGSSALVKEHLLQILGSFEESINLLTSASEANGLSQIAVVDGGERVPPVDRSSKGNSDRSKKRLGVKDRRGCYRRRNSAQSWVEMSPRIEDGYAWRKYGQKYILNNTFPRCYYRCTHKNDQGCKATKQVQMIKDDPLLYKTTYFGLHTCQKCTLARVPQIISEPDPMEPCLLSFQTKTPPEIPPHVGLTVNQEMKDETQSDVTDSKSCLDSSMWQDMMPSESSGTKKLEPSNANRSFYNDQEVVSSFHSCSSTPLQHRDLVDVEDLPTEFADLRQELYLDVIQLNQLPFSS